MNPRDTLSQGVEILDPVLEPAGFRFVIGECGIGSGGEFASGAYQRGERQLELHFRRSLGLVTYHLGTDHIGHRDLMRALGHVKDAAYPGYSEDPLAAFRDLRTDLERFGADFLTGPGDSIKHAAREATIRDALQLTSLQADYAGDSGRRERARGFFHEGKYSEAGAEFRGVTYPDLLTESERRMWHLAEDRSQPSSGS